MTELSWPLFALFVVFISLFLLWHLLLEKLKIRFLSESLITIIYALIVGLLDWLISGGSVLERIKFNRDLFYFFILPPIIFESGFVLKKSGFFSNLTSILLFAVVGTMISTIVIGFLTFVGGNLGIPGIGHNNLIESFILAAALSAVDPIATLSFLYGKFDIQDKRENPLLYNLIFGESVLNDAVSIVLYHIFSSFALQEGPFTTREVMVSLGRFLLLTFGSVLIGLAVGFACTILFRYVRFRNTFTEILVLYMFGYVSYLLAEGLKFSGIMSIFTCGVILGHYAWYNVTTLAQVTSPTVFRVISTMSETYIFMFLGLSITSMHANTWNWGFLFFTLFLCYLSRAVNIFPLSALVNLRRRVKFTYSMQFFMWFSGLRGAIAFVLAVDYTNLKTKISDSAAENMCTCVLFIVIFTIVVNGSFSAPLLDLVQEAQVSSQPPPDKERRRNWLSRLDSRFLRPLLRREDADGYSEKRIILLFNQMHPGGYLRDETLPRKSSDIKNEEATNHDHAGEEEDEIEPLLLEKN